MTKKRRARPTARHAMLLTHRWIGLTITVFLVLLGITGSLIAFNDELEAWISPELFCVKVPNGETPFLDPLVLRKQVLAAHPTARVDWLELTPRAGRAMVFGLEPGQGTRAPLNSDQVFVDPYTGKILGERNQADLGQGWKNAMPFVYSLHVSLASGDVGVWVLGMAALLWSIDCFAGFYLTLPVGRASPKPWASRWAPAWKLRWGASWPKLAFDLHRAGGLWAWAMLFVLAWSGVGFNLNSVYQPVMHAVTGYEAPLSRDALAVRRAAGVGALDWSQARRLAREAMQGAALRQGFQVRRERLLHHDTLHGLYEYRVLSTLDVGDKLGNTTLFLDDQTGVVVHLEVPTGRHLGNTLDTWMSSIHTGAWGGLFMQIGLCMTGFLIVMLSGTGVWLWWKRRLARRRTFGQ